MKIEKIDGEQFIVLEDNDRVYLTTSDNLGKRDIKIAATDDKLDISGSSELVGSIKGDGMLEKVYIPPIYSKDEIIEKCDEWIDKFKSVHDAFRELAISRKYREQRVVMHLSFSQFFSWQDKSIKGNIISLDLTQNGITIQEGVSVSVDEVNSTIYAYLVANVLSYYLEKNYGSSKIDNFDLNWNHTLYSNIEVPRAETRPLAASLSSLYDVTSLARIATSLIGSHNLGIHADQIIFNLKNDITNQYVSERFFNSIDYSTTQYEYIAVKKEKQKQAVLNKNIPQN